jgi:hypothetical protein
VPHEGKVLIIDEKQTYLLNGKKGVARPFSNAIKLQVNAMARMQSIGTHLIRSTEDEIHSLNLRTGELIRLAQKEGYPATYSYRVSASGNAAYIDQVGRTDGEAVDSRYGTVLPVFTLNGRTFFRETGVSGSIYYTRESVNGEIFNDENRNSLRDADETFSAGRRVFLDLNNDGRWQKREPSDFTDSNGRYAFWDLTGKSVTVRVVPDEDHLDPGARLVRLDRMAVGRNFALMPAGKVRVSAFTDANGNGRREKGEHFWAYTDFWLDLNRNGIHDAGEPLATSTFAYTFGSLKPGKYLLRTRVRTEDLAGFIAELTTPDSYEIKITSGSRTREFGVRYVSDGSPPGN